MGFFPKSKWVWAFALISLIQACIILALEGFVFVRFDNDLQDRPNRQQQRGDPTTTVPTFFALYIFAFVYQLILVWDALRMKNTIQIIGLVGLNVGLLIYGAVQIDQFHDSSDQLIQLSEFVNESTWRVCRPILIVIPCVLALTTIMLGFVAYKLYNEFAWTIYKHISADLRMKRRYLLYQVYVALLKFDAFFCIGFTIQFVVIVGGNGPTERILTGCSIPVTVIIMLAAFFFVRRESLIGTIAVMLLYFGGLAYFLFKFVRMYTPGKMEPYLSARKELTTFAVLTILLLTLTIVVACMCAHNYGRGLKPYIMHSNTKAVVGPNDRPDFDMAHGQPQNTSYPMSDNSYAQKLGVGRPQAARMEID